MSILVRGSLLSVPVIPGDSAHSSPVVAVMVVQGVPIAYEFARQSSRSKR